MSSFEEYMLDQGESAEEIVLERINREILRERLSSLPFIYKEVLVLFYFEGLTVKEISHILREKEGTIKSKLSRGRKMLKNALVKGGDLFEG